MKDKESLKKLIPLTETTFYVLISVLEPLHGYGIMQKVERLSNGRIHFGPGTLYGAMNNLQSLGLISLVSGEMSGEGERRKVYRVTEKGRAVVGLEVERLRELLANAEILLSDHAD